MAEDDRMTRQQYRQQQAQPESAAPEASKPASSDYDEQPADETTDSSRRAYAAETNRALEDAKSKRLGRKLNWVILGLVLAITIVFLILFLTP